jgi:hypothetical protein
MRLDAGSKLLLLLLFASAILAPVAAPRNHRVTQCL